MNVRGNSLRRILGRVLAGLLVAAASAVVLVPAVPAQAAPANLWGFGFSNTPLPVGNHVLPPATEASSPPGHGAFVRRLAVGSYRVTFLGLGTPAGGGPGVVHLTAAPLMPAPVWCQARDWGPRNGNEVIDVICYQAQGATAVPKDTDFSVAFSWWQAGPSAGPPFGYLESPGGNGTVTQYHSAGGPITSIQVAAGMWRVTMPGLGGPAPQAGSIQVTPATFSPEHCKVNRWGSSPQGQVIYVMCVTPTGAPANLRWNLTYHFGRDITGRVPVPTDFGYIWNTTPPVPVPTNFNSCGGVNVIVHHPGFYTVAFPCIFAPQNNVLLSASGPASGPNDDFCNMTGAVPWSASGTTVVVRDVRCWTIAGALSPADDFFTTYTAR